MFINDNDDSNNYNNNNDNNHNIEMRILRFLTISSLWRALSPAHTLRWPEHIHVQITCKHIRCSVTCSDIQDVSAHLFSLVEFKSPLFLHSIGIPMSKGRKPEYPSKIQIKSFRRC